MRTPRLGLAVALALGALLALAPTLARPQPASACSLAPLTVAERFEQFPPLADSIVVVEVIEEHSDAGNTRLSIVRVLETLHGDAEGEIALPRLGSLGASCEGGPRLQVGERALLFLDDRPPLAEAIEWAILAGGQGVIRERAGHAFWDLSHLGESDLVAVGPVEGTVRIIAERAGAVDADIPAAVAALRGETPLPAVSNADRDEVGHATGIVQVALVLAAGVAAFAVALPIMRWGNRRPE